jgi:hypothetical protein
MKITEANGRMVIADTPGCLWLFGLMFVASGLLVLSVPFTSESWIDLVLWLRCAVFAIGASHFAAGLWTIRRHAATRTELDRATGTGTHRVRSPGARVPTVTAFPLGDVRAVEIRPDKDSDGDPMFQLRLWLRDSRVLPLQSQPAHGESRTRENAERIRRFLGL